MSSKMVTLLYQYELRGDNLALLYQYAFKNDNLELLMKCHVELMVLFRGDHLTLL